MKRILAGVILGVLIALPVGVGATRIIEYPRSNPIYNIETDADVSVFDDEDNKCYVLFMNANSDEGDISCVKQ